MTLNQRLFNVDSTLCGQWARDFVLSMKVYEYAVFMKVRPMWGRGEE